jgi:methionine import ATP-binding protein metN
MLLRLTFLGESADNPVLADMIRLFPDIEVTMLFGTLDQIKEMPFGRMIIGMRGERAEIEAAIAYLSAQHLKQEVIGYVRRNDAPLN